MLTSLLFNAPAIDTNVLKLLVLVFVAFLFVRAQRAMDSEGPNKKKD